MSDLNTDICDAGEDDIRAGHMGGGIGTDNDPDFDMSGDDADREDSDEDHDRCDAGLGFWEGRGGDLDAQDVLDEDAMTMEGGAAE
jgi:hypothetical protein